MARLVLNQLTRSFGDVTAVDRISLDVADGDFLVLLGPSGCGKTTLLRMIAGLLEPTGGSIEIDGTDITGLPARKRDLAMVFQSYALYPHLSVAKNLAFPLRVRGTAKSEITERVRVAAESVEIGHLLDRKPKELSGGQRQRVAVARALVREPQAFLMDEPLSNLDAKLRTATRQELAALHRTLGATFVYVTHDQVEAMTMATKIALLNGGRLEQFGTPEELYDTPSSVFAAGFLGSPAMNLMDASLTTTAGTISVLAPGIEAMLWPGSTPEREIVVGVRPEHLRVHAGGAPAAVPTAGIALRGTVELVENLGREQLVHCTVGEDRVTVACDRDAQWRPGELVVLDAPSAHVHLFDRASGRRLEWQPDADAVPSANTELPIGALRSALLGATQP
ncbi:Glycerol-3-phosphate ABC transporter, ATP-binding protein UgpC (TC 3.A.1.1.3) [Leucobacter sp. 7(1)]|uniref:ABC transporter ATP-binding protein n=1 Tax=Leucobacter sp. 7(1) TaxID=1255613 RepID=UPI00097EE2C9|nr:ABC transporter ATP-binding protein [Leucobacter sp. 7(1)]SJN12339.1 Glycerol-3-phosphate ABC transporter, ATP-binding protein UgpC (TC 3.A.1.1.3) [Leucobacter sp. 7(1)]